LPESTFIEMKESLYFNSLSNFKGKQGPLLISDMCHETFQTLEKQSISSNISCSNLV